MKRWVIMLIAVLLIVALVGGLKYRQIQQMYGHPQPPPKQAVSTALAQMSDWQPQISAVGNVHAARGADLAAEVGGVVDAISFNSGEEVKQGQPLMQLRAGDEAARVAALKASAELAAQEHQRAQAQFEFKAISQAQLQTSTAQLASAQAQLSEARALLAKKSIRAPFAGRVGIRAVDVGQFVAPGAKLVSLQQIDPVYVDFFVPQQELGHIVAGQTVTAKTDAYPGAIFSGRIEAIDSALDVETRNARVRAALPNHQRKLLPGMSASVTVDTGAPAKYLTLPLTAVTYNPYGETVFVVVKATAFAAANAQNAPPDKGDKKGAPNTPPPGPDDLVTQQVFVTAGPARGGEVAILKGIKAGDVVVTSGQLKLKNGAAVTVNNDVMPSRTAAPQTVDE